MWHRDGGAEGSEPWLARSKYCFSWRDCVWSCSCRPDSCRIVQSSQCCPTKNNAESVLRHLRIHQNSSVYFCRRVQWETLSTLTILERNKTEVWQSRAVRQREASVTLPVLISTAATAKCGHSHYCCFPTRSPLVFGWETALSLLFPPALSRWHYRTAEDGRFCCLICYFTDI